MSLTPATHARGLTIIDLTDDLAPAFCDANAERPPSKYCFKPMDLGALRHRRSPSIDSGSGMLCVEADGLGVLRACALQRTGEWEFELTTMGVLEGAPVRNPGELLLRALIEQVQELGAEFFHYLSNSRSGAADHLYEKLGSLAGNGSMRSFGARHGRSNAAMRFSRLMAPDRWNHWKRTLP